jgi:uncharacterized protein (TIGR00290 family)
VKRRALVSWSSGKDGAWALHQLRSASDVDVIGLLTTVGAESDRVPMHAVPTELVRAQAAAAGLPLLEVPIPEPCSNADYEAAMRNALDRARSDGVDAIAFGDLFLEDIRAYRESRLAGSGITPLFPLWRRPTAALAHEMLAAGVRAIVTSVDLSKLDRELCGRSWDARFVAELPAGVDPCGEHGEFHTFVWDGPMLTRPLSVTAGEVRAAGGFAHLELRASGS